jgi:hypothetical protein
MIVILITLVLGVWFTYYVLFKGNPFSTFSVDDVDNLFLLWGVSLFIAYLTFAFIPLVFKPEALYRFLKYSAYLLPFTVYAFLVFPSTAMFAPGINEVSIGLALLHIPVALFAIYREHKLGSS